MSRYWTLSVKMPPHIRWLVLPRYLVAKTWPCIWSRNCPHLSCLTCRWNASHGSRPCCAALRCAALICTTQGNRGLMWRDAAVHLYLHICCIAVWDVLPGEQLCNHHGYPFSSLVPCPANVKGTGFCSAQTRLFLSQLTEDGLTFQLQSLISPSYCLKFHPFTDS